MKLWFAKVRRGEKAGLIPTDEDSRALVNRLGDGECVQVEVTRCRSVQWNKLYWSLCQTIGVNQDPQRSKDSIDAELRIRAGHFDVMFIDGHECRVPRRIAFSHLSADEWSELWPSLELAIREHFGEEYIQERAA